MNVTNTHTKFDNNWCGSLGYYLSKKIDQTWTADERRQTDRNERPTFSYSMSHETSRKHGSRQFPEELVCKTSLAYGVWILT